MQLRYEQLTTHLQKSLTPIYFVCGDVPFLLQEASDNIRKAAQQHGYNDKQVFQVESGFAWQEFLSTAYTFSLFSDKQFLELRLSNTLGEGGSKAMQQYISNLPKNKILLITAQKIESQQQKSIWFQTLVKASTFVQLWPITYEQMPAWIMQRLTQAGLQTSNDGIRILAERAEGNLLAAAQEIEKLRLLYGQGTITTEAITQAVTDSARFDVFQLADACLQGNCQRALRILSGLHAEHIEPTLILWAIAREVRTLLAMSYEIASGASIDQALQKQQVWEKRKPYFRQALRSHTVNSTTIMIQHANRIDLIIKGLKIGNIWNELEQLVLAMGKK